MTAADGTDAVRAAVPTRGETDSRGGILNARAFRRSKLVYGTMAVAQGGHRGKKGAVVSEGAAVASSEPNLEGVLP